MGLYLTIVQLYKKTSKKKEKEDFKHSVTHDLEIKKRIVIYHYKLR